MTKLQQFDIYAFNFSRLKNNNFNLTNIDPNQARLNEEIISLADNEVLRAIRRITHHSYCEKTLTDLISSRKYLYKQKNTEQNKLEIKNINKEITKQLFVPEYVSITTEKKRDYNIIGKNGFSINGRHYVRLLCGAGHARTNRTMFVLEEIHAELNSILKNGANSIKMVAAKYNAYFSLTSSSTYIVSNPRVCVVADKEVKRIKRVDWVTEDAYQDIIEECDKELEFNLWDGMGIISPQFAEQWAKDIGLDYLPSAYCIRSAYIKGMVCVFDFCKFAREVANKHTVTDIYGVSYNVEEIDIFITQSQFKLWNAYDSWQHYESCLEESGIQWGVSRFTPQVDKDFIRTNYQFIQVLQMKDIDIEELCRPTIDWIKSVSGGDISAMSLYLMGRLAKESNPYKIWNNIQDSYLKALLLCPDLIRDNYIKNRIVASLNKRIRETYIGKLIVEGNFQTMLGDPYAFCEYIFGLEIKGLLKENEHFSWYWNKKGIKQVVAMRSPLTWRSEVNLLNLQDNSQVKEWYKYIKSAIIYNVWGCDHMLHAGSDLDGDIVCTTSNPVFLRCRTGGLPVTYEPKNTDKIKIKEGDLYKTDVLAYNTKIGFITNCGTSLYEIQSQFPKGSKEYNEVNTRLKLCCKEQSATIDSAKGIKCKDFPKHWTRWQNPEKASSSEERDRIIFNNSMLIEKRPYFMRYLYPAYNKLYKTFLADIDRYSYTQYKVGYNSLKRGGNGKLIDKDLEVFYNRINPLLTTQGTMNKVCYHMEKEMAEVKRSYTKKYDTEISKLLYDRSIGILESDVDKMRDIHNQYTSFKSSKALASSEFSTYQQFYKYLRNYSLEEINSDIGYLANLAVYLCYHLDEGKRDFVWDCFGRGVVINLSKHKKSVSVPILDSNGDISYLTQRYKMEDINIDNI